ncbi:hypothetical protein [Pleionea sediminis]|uniref:hypothetical protein n=1 Tax=Pleionea sediminis TaxID=2569479 RepID=UPI001184B9FB|nr:hypothetical protein [Pleionea sediminis]
MNDFVSGRDFRLGDMLVESGKISSEQLHQALAYHRNYKIAIGQALLALGFIRRRQLKYLLRRQKVLRFIASILMAVVPASYCMASDPVAFSANLASKDITKNFTFHAESKSENTYSIDFRYRISDKSNINLGFNQYADSSEKIFWQPEISYSQQDSFFNVQPRQYYKIASLNGEEYNRYKDNSPALFRLALRSTPRNDNNLLGVNLFNLERDDGDIARNYEVTFSVSKQFD